MQDPEHHLVTALSAESWPGALQTTQKHIRGWKIGLEAEMGFLVSEFYGLPVNAKSLVGSVMANLCGSHYPLQMRTGKYLDRRGEETEGWRVNLLR